MSVRKTIYSFLFTLLEIWFSFFIIFGCFKKRKEMKSKIQKTNFDFANKYKDL